MKNHPPICYACGDANLHFVLSLGQIPDADSFLTEDSPSKRQAVYPLVVFFCPNCALMQIAQPSPAAGRPRRRASLYSTAGGHSTRESSYKASDLIQMRSLHSASLVVNVGSDDQSMLRGFVEHGISVVDVRSREVHSRMGWCMDDDTVLPSFNAKRASILRGQAGSADVIIERHALERTDDPDDFVEGIHILLKDDGLAIIEVPYVRDLIDRRAFDSINHDQLCYFSFTALHHLLERHSLFANHVERLPACGGSLRLHVGHEPAFGQSVRSLLEEEAAAEVDRVRYYETFAGRVRSIRDWLLDLLWGVKSRGKRIAAYWADIRGATLINYLGIGTELIDFVVDPHTDLHGCYMAGKHLPIQPCERLLSSMPDYVLLLRWECAEEIFKHEAEYLERGGVFITPLPYPTCTSRRTTQRVR